MGKRVLTLSKVKTLIMGMALAIGLVTGLSFGPWTSPVAADSGTELNTCPRFFAHQAGRAIYQAPYIYYGWTPQYTIPSASPCEDINLGNFWAYNAFGEYVDGCADFRVRFYPSSGGSYYNSWRNICTWDEATIVTIATDVLNGTHYRVEFKNAIFPGDSYSFSIWH